MRAPISFATAAVIAAFFTAASGTYAQSPTPPAKSGAATRAATIPDHKLDAAATAIQKVAKVSQDYQQQMAEAPPPDKERIAKEANTAMVQAVTEQGLSVDEYNSIVDTAQRDPAVHDKIIQRLKANPQ
jgi:hypothetical protein